MCEFLRLASVLVPARIETHGCVFRPVDAIGRDVDAKFDKYCDEQNSVGEGARRRRAILYGWLPYNADDRRDRSCMVSGCVGSAGDQNSHADALQGPLAILGQDGRKGIEIAVQEINDAGGIGGRKLVIEFADLQGKPDVARREMERLAKPQKAPLVLGCDISAATSTAAQFAEAENAVPEF